MLKSQMDGDREVAPAMFEEFAEEYEAHARDSAYNAHYDRPAVLELLGDVKGRRVLDAGCGPGFYAEELLSRQAEVVAIDVSQRMVELAGKRLGDRAEVRRHDLSTPLDWLDEGSFDAAIVALVIHHLDDRVSALQHLHRVLRPNGVLVLSTHHPVSDWLRIGGSYFEIEKLTEQWQTSWQVSFWRQPLEATCEEFRRAGFAIDRLVEPRPVKTMKERYPEQFDKLSREPGFIAFRLRKV